LSLLEIEHKAGTIWEELAVLAEVKFTPLKIKSKMYGEMAIKKRIRKNCNPSLFLYDFKLVFIHSSFCSC
jgi:NifU-like protein involved in Fe-S cluster formation